MVLPERRKPGCDTVLEAAGPHRGIGLGNPARGGEHECKRVFGRILAGLAAAGDRDRRCRA